MELSYEKLLEGAGRCENSEPGMWCEGCPYRWAEDCSGALMRQLRERLELAVRELEALMGTPLSSCNYCAKRKECPKTGDCVPEWRGRCTG